MFWLMSVNVNFHVSVYWLSMALRIFLHLRMAITQTGKHGEENLPE